MGTGAAIFDFDKTLIRQESMGMFLRTVGGRQAYVSACCAGIKAAIAAPRNRHQIFRAEVLRRILVGKTIIQTQESAEYVFTHLDWINRTIEALARHKGAGHRILIATGSLSVYVPAFLKMGGIYVDTLLMTEIGTDGDVLTGEMTTASCTWMEKARRVKAWLNSIDGPVWGYGNLPCDKAMLALTDYPMIV